MKQIDGKARRVAKYDPLFFWCIPIVAIAALLLAFFAFPEAWPATVAGLLSGLGLGFVICLLWRDVP